MTAAYRAWRFVNSVQTFGGDAEPTETLSGLSISPRGTVDMIEGNEAVRQALLLLIATVPGERVMRPEYGCDLHRLVFSPNDDTTAGLAMHYVRRAIERWEPRAEILRLDARANPDVSEWLDITLDYRVRETQQLQSLRFSYDLAGADR